jgi:hypothetical protein
MTDKPPDWESVDKVVDDYVDNYEMYGETDDGRDCTYSPNDRERMLIRGAIVGLIADNEFCSALYVAQKHLGDLREAEGNCRYCGHPNGGHWGACIGESPALETGPDEPASVDVQFGKEELEEAFDSYAAKIQGSVPSDDAVAVLTSLLDQCRPYVVRADREGPHAHPALLLRQIEAVRTALNRRVE